MRQDDADFCCFSKFQIQNSKFHAAFTLIELLLVVAIATLLVGVTLSFGVNFYRIQALDETSENILMALRRAREQAVAQKNDSSFGVRLLSGSYVLFQGSSYDNRVAAEDEVFPLSSLISLGGMTETVFAKHSGMPSATGVLIVSSGADIREIDVGSQGKIERY